MRLEGSPIFSGVLSFESRFQYSPSMDWIAVQWRRLIGSFKNPPIETVERDLWSRSIFRGRSTLLFSVCHARRLDTSEIEALLELQLRLKQRNYAKYPWWHLYRSFQFPERTCEDSRRKLAPVYCKLDPARLKKLIFISRVLQSRRSTFGEFFVLENIVQGVKRA